MMRSKSSSPVPSWLRLVAMAAAVLVAALFAGPAPRRSNGGQAGARQHVAPANAPVNAAPAELPPEPAPAPAQEALPEGPAPDPAERPMLHVKGPTMVVTVTLSRPRARTP